MDDLVSHVTLADGRRVVLHDEDDISLSLVSNNGVEETLPFSHLSGNYGGGSLLLSPSQRYVIFSYFSGESEEGFALLEIANNQLKLLYDSDYIYGEDANYGFTNDERTIIQTFRTGAWYKDEAEIDKNGDMYYEFGEFNLLSLETNNLNRHTILVYPSDDWKEEETDVGTFSFSGIADGMLRVEMPWGSEAFQYPLQERDLSRVFFTKTFAVIYEFIFFNFLIKDRQTSVNLNFHVIKENLKRSKLKLI